LDIDKNSAQLTPQIVENYLNKNLNFKKNVIAVMPVSPFGAKINKEVWDIFKIKHDIEIVYDEAWSFDSFKKGIHGNSVISLHATKSLGCGEGGVIIANTTEEGEKFRRLINFGFDENKNSDFVGTNAKMSEYSAAVALASLDGWKKNKKEILIKQSYYLNKINSFSNIQVLAGFTNKWVWGALPIILNNSNELSKLIEAAKLQGIEMRNWWGPGVHRFPWSKHYMNFNLANTNKYSYKLINIPFFQEISFDHINKICEILKNFDM
jgi:dTDP-4-amino-4,6-dideoxygalactose transaminase